MDWLDSFWDYFWALPSGAWAAIAAWVTVAIAGGTVAVTGRYAKKQIEQAREQISQAEQSRIDQLAQAEQARQQQANDAQELRREQAQPNVVVFMEPDKNHWGFCNLVVRNFGLTPAYDITLHFDPELDVASFDRLDTGERVTQLAYPKHPFMLAPGQEWRTNWDYAPDRNQHDPPLTPTFNATVVYRGAGSNDRRFETKAILDWTTFDTTVTVETKNLHDLVKDFDKKLKSTNQHLENIAKSLAEFGDEHKGVWVYPTDAEGERQHRVEQQRAREERGRAAMARLGALRARRGEQSGTAE